MIHDRATQLRLGQAKQRIKRTFWSQRNVTGVGIGLRMRAGEWTDEPAITVMVAKKRRPGYLRSDQMLPSYVDIDGRPHRVDVVETGRIRSAGAAVRQPPTNCLDQEFNGGDDEWILTGRSRPLQPGSVIANRSTISGGVAYGGTLGGFVRGKADDQIYILSNAHILMDKLVDPTIGQQIVNPTEDNDEAVVATTHAFYPRVPGAGYSNVADAALALLVNQDPTGFSLEYPGARMPPAAPGHEAIGLFFAADSASNTFNYICRIKPILDRFNVDFLLPGSYVDVTPAHINRTIDKVGARSGYSSSRIYGVETDIKLTEDTGEEIYYTNVIFTNSIGWPGDSGAIVCLGGDGCTWTPGVPFSNEAECIVFLTLAIMYGLPLQNDTALGDRIRDDFLAQSRLGRALTQIFYLNSENMVTRAEHSATSDYEKAGARSLYDKYRNFVDSALNNPEDPSLQVTQENLDDIQFAINGASLQMTSLESNALVSIYNEIVAPTLGMRYADLLVHMNDPVVYDRVQDLLIPVPTLLTQGMVEPN